MGNLPALDTDGHETPMTGDHLDLTSDSPDDRTGGSRPGRRRFVGIHFVCCGVYSRVYVNRDETAYQGYCPRCSRQVRLKIGPGGTDQRIFTAY
jgi:hypothetical protein